MGHGTVTYNPLTHGPKGRIRYELEKVRDSHSFLGGISETRKSYTQYFLIHIVQLLIVPKGKAITSDFSLNLEIDYMDQYL